MTLHCFKVTWKDKGEVSHVIHIYEEFESTMQSLAQFWAFIVKGDSYGSDIVDDLQWSILSKSLRQSTARPLFLKTTWQFGASGLLTFWKGHYFLSLIMEFACTTCLALTMIVRESLY